MKIYFQLFILHFIIVSNLFGLGIRNLDTDRHNRFSSGYPTSPVENNNFFLSALDLSGVGWKQTNSNFSYTMISPQHFIGANHNKPNVGNVIDFFNRDGILKSYAVSAIHNIQNELSQNVDIFIGEFANPIDEAEAISFYPLLDLESETDYVGLNLLVYGKVARMGVGVINSFGDLFSFNSTRAYSFIFDNTTGAIDDAFGENGDSGSPSFVSFNGSLAITGTHTAASPTGLQVTTFDSFVPNYISEINSIIAVSGYQVTTIPESSKFSLILLSTIFCARLLKKTGTAWFG